MLRGMTPKERYFDPMVSNKAVYTAALVANGWAGAGNLEKTDRRTDGPKSGL